MEQQEQPVATGPVLATEHSAPQDATPLQEVIAFPPRGGVQCLPVELLVEIFRLCIAPTFVPRFRSSTQHPKQYIDTVAIAEYGKLKPKEFYTWISIAMVCKSWREVALEASALWTNIQITRQALPTANLFLERSQTAALNVVAHVVEDDKSVYDDKVFRDECTLFIGTIMKHSARIKRLAFTICLRHFEEENEPLQIAPVRDAWRPDFSHLTHLEFGSEFTTADSFLDNTFAAIVPDVNSLSRLETLIMPCSEPDSVIRWLVPSLKTLRLFISALSSLQFTGLLVALTGLKKLETLSWMEFEVDFPESEVISAKATIPTLRRLDLYFEYVSNNMAILLDHLVISPTRVSFHVYEDDNPLHESLPIMMDVGEKLRTTLSHPGMPRIQTIHMHTSDNHEYYVHTPEVSVQCFSSQPVDNEPVLTLGMVGHEAIRIFTGGFVEKFPFQDVTCLSLSYGVHRDRNRIFRDMSPGHWHAAFKHLGKVQALALHGSPPKPLLTALDPRAAPDGLLLFPQLNTLHLRGVDFYSLDGAPDGVRWCRILWHVLAARRVANNGVKRLLVWKCFNFPIHDHPRHEPDGYKYTDLVEFVVWDKLSMVKSL